MLSQTDTTFMKKILPFSLQIQELFSYMKQLECKHEFYMYIHVQIARGYHVGPKTRCKIHNPIQTLNEIYKHNTDIISIYSPFSGNLMKCDPFWWQLYHTVKWNYHESAKMIIWHENSQQSDSFLPVVFWAKGEH